MEAWRTFNDGDVKVVVEIDGKNAKAIPWRAADAIADALHANARICEQNEKAQQVIYDAAILARTGIPVGLIHNDPKMTDEARKESMYNRDIRRSNLPKIGSVPSQEVFGTPTIIKTPSMEQLRAAACQNSKH